MDRTGQKFLDNGKILKVVSSYEHSTFKGWSHMLEDVDGNIVRFTENEIRDLLDNGSFVFISDAKIAVTDWNREYLAPEATNLDVTKCDHKWKAIYGLSAKPLGWDCEHCGAKREDVEV